MHIGILIPEFPGQTHIMFWREVVALRDAGHSVQILSTRRNKTGHCSHDFARSDHRAVYCWPPSANRVCRSVLRAPAAAVKSLGYALGLRRSGGVLRRIGLWVSALDLGESLRSFALDHVHVHSAADAAHVTAMASLVSGVPYSIRLHGDLDAYGGDHHAKFQNAEFVISASRRHIEEAVERKCVREGRYGCVPMGVDMTAVVPRRKSVGTPLRIITVARLNRAKGHEIALNALRRCRDQGVDFRYTIVGGGDYRPTVERRIDDLGLRDWVVMKGSLDAATVAECLADHDVFLLPSTGIGEAAPVSVMEAMASGLAVVCSAIGDTPDMVRDGVDGFVTKQGDVPGVAAAIQRLHADRELLERCGQSACLRASKNFNCVRQAEQLVEWILKESLRGCAAGGNVSQ